MTNEEFITLLKVLEEKQAQLDKILEISEINLSLECDPILCGAEWGAIIDIIKGVKE
tara:strand:- start:340 stop:510 length:171 start_codon:yes stop_codon:yes gene_type:complete